MKSYVLGFLTDERHQFLLMRKIRPFWQRGCLNGIGGKMEDGESPAEAMYREAEEEAGLSGIKWQPMGKLEGLDGDGEEFVVYVYRARVREIKFQQRTDETLVVMTYQDAMAHRYINNLAFLLPMALYWDSTMVSFNLKYT